MTLHSTVSVCACTVSDPCVVVLRVFVFVCVQAGGGESVEMTRLSQRGLAHRRRTDPVSERGSEEMVFIWHDMEPHHTIAGIALQYRVTVEQLMRVNQLQTQQELHSRKRIMVRKNANEGNRCSVCTA